MGLQRSINAWLRGGPMTLEVFELLMRIPIISQEEINHSNSVGFRWNIPSKEDVLKTIAEMKPKYNLRSNPYEYRWIDTGNDKQASIVYTAELFL